MPARKQEIDVLAFQRVFDSSVDADVLRERERRVAERKVISLRAQIELPNGSVLTGQSADISRSGVAIISPSKVKADRDCRVTIDLSVCGTAKALMLTGRACYCTELAPTKFRVGMRFVGMNAHVSELLETLLR